MRTVTLAAVAMAVWFPCRAHAGPVEHIYELTLDGKRIGFSRYTLTRRRDGLAVQSDTLIRVSLLGSPFDMRYHGDALYRADTGQPQRYHMTLQRGRTTTRVLWTIGGRVARCTQAVAGKASSKSVAWDSATWLVEGNSLDTWNMSLRHTPSPMPSRVRVLSVSSGTSEVVRPVRLGAETLTYGGRRYVCDRLQVGTGAAAVVLVIARATRQVMEMRVPGQKAVFRLADASALTGIKTYDAGSKLFSIVQEPLPSGDRLTFLRVRARIEVAGEKPTVASLQSPFQKFAGVAAAGRIEGVFETRPFRYDAANAPRYSEMPPRDPSLAKYLKPEANVESDNPEIQALARQIVSGSQTAWEAVQRIGTWIKENISYAITGSGALECLRTKRGDCGPHTWLTIALCRAAGIPARITGGVLYSEALGGSFGQHYWTRVWMGQDGWIPIDTTTSEVGTLSPAHITLWNLAGLRSVRIEVLDYEPKRSTSPTAPTVQLRRYRPAEGDSERWVFIKNGTELGEQTARCVRVAGEQDRTYSDWTYGFRITESGQTVSMIGGYSVWEDGTPRKLTFEASGGNVRQTGSYTFSGDTVEAELKLGEMPVKRSVSCPAGTLLQMNNLLSLFSLTTRALALKAGETRTVPFFAASALQMLDLTFRCTPATASISVLGGQRTCVVCDVEPIRNRFFMDVETGELLRVEIDSAKLVIERR